MDPSLLALLDIGSSRWVTGFKPPACILGLCFALTSFAVLTLPAFWNSLRKVRHEAGITDEATRRTKCGSRELQADHSEQRARDGKCGWSTRGQHESHWGYAQPAAEQTH